MEKTAISLFKDGKFSELEKFMKGIKTDEVKSLLDRTYFIQEIVHRGCFTNVFQDLCLICFLF